MRNFRLSRRALLRGTGACLALPYLEAMLPAPSQAQAANKPLRFIVWTLPDGVRMDAWTPAQTGAGYTLTPILQPLAAYRDRFNVVSGLQQTAWLKGPGGGHANGIPNFATAVPSLVELSKTVMVLKAAAVPVSVTVLP